MMSAAKNTGKKETVKDVETLRAIFRETMIVGQEETERRLRMFVEPYVGSFDPADTRQMNAIACEVGNMIAREEAHPANQWFAKAAKKVFDGKKYPPLGGSKFIA